MCNIKTAHVTSDPFSFPSLEGMSYKSVRALESPGGSVVPVASHQPAHYLAVHLKEQKCYKVIFESVDCTRMATVRGLLMSSGET